MVPFLAGYVALALGFLAPRRVAGVCRAWSTPAGRWLDVGERTLLVALLALAILAALTAWVGPRIDGVGGFVALYLAWISALTMPHLAVVAWMDRGAVARSAT